MSGRRPRGGFTTGSAATAAAVAALCRILDGESPESVDIPVPPGAVELGRLVIPIAETAAAASGGPDEFSAMAVVIKDGGDDPDVTHRARIEAHVRFRPVPRPPGQNAVRLILEGGEGVGRVTLPGLPVRVGEAAVNPGPRAQIMLAVNEVCAARGREGEITVCIRVPDGERLARRTLNARLGIVGGISILGTQGTTRPFSHEAWQRAIEQALDVAEATGCRCLGLCSGRRSERLLMARYPDWPAQAFVQAADFIGFAAGRAAGHAFAGLVWGCFFGKMLKLAQGHAFTHARAGAPDLAALAAFCARRGAAPGCVAAVRAANTAAQALDIVLDDVCSALVLHDLAREAGDRLERLARSGPRALPVTVRLFHLDGRELACSKETDL